MGIHGKQRSSLPLWPVKIWTYLPILVANRKIGLCNHQLWYSCHYDTPHLELSVSQQNQGNCGTFTTHPANARSKRSGFHEKYGSCSRTLTKSRALVRLCSIFSQMSLKFPRRGSRSGDAAPDQPVCQLPIGLGDGSFAQCSRLARIAGQTHLKLQRQRP